MLAINIENIYKRYDSERSIFQRLFCKNRNIKYALNDINIQIEPGDFFGLLGPNGAGKTSLISILAGLSIPTKGKISIFGYDIVKNHSIVRRLVGTVPQELVFDPFFTVRETLKLQSGYFGIKNNDKWIDEIIFNLGLEDKANANMRSLSGGMKRRVLVGQALVHKPSIIILDEPTAGVDVNLRKTLWDFIISLNKNGHTIVLTTHYMEEAELLCKKIAILKNGSIVALDKTSNILSSFGEKDLEKVFLKITENIKV